ncbi:MAG: Two-component sensor histidine kinase, contains HisKA and HATPase domain [Devosia sp.]|jgi:two-component sensor histidine kinase|nr:Two-component sensor histidine kinase, contains HisKA and HATPase domain [Devosia sp.]
MPSTFPEPPSALRLRALSAGLAGQGICILHQNTDGRFDLAENLPPAWAETPVIGGTERDLLPEALAEAFAQAVAECRSTGQEQTTSLELADASRRRQFDVRFLPDIEGTIIVLNEVTDERSREAAIAALLREVSHRSKNLLAIVQSVAMQTAHHSGGIKDFLDKFRGRLHALSSTQDLVTESNWQGTHLQSLVASQLTRVSSGMLKEMRITGDNPLLGPNAALHIGLAIHELAANAVFHGALSDGQMGHVWIDAKIDQEDGQPPSLVIEWQETGIDTDKTRQAPRFGTMVLERIVPLSVGGSATFSIEEDRLSYRLRVPADQFEA